MATDTTTPPPPDQATEPVDPPEITGEQWAGLLGTLGLESTASFDDVLDTVTGLVTDEAAKEGGSEAIAAAAGRRGLTVLDTATVTALRAAADEGRQIKAAADEQHRETVIMAAVRRGAITRGRADHWRNLLTADPGSEKILASIPDQTAIPLAEMGHGLDRDNTTDTLGRIVDHFTDQADTTWFR